MTGPYGIRTPDGRTVYYGQTFNFTSDVDNRRLVGAITAGGAHTPIVLEVGHTLQACFEINVDHNCVADGIAVIDGDDHTKFVFLWADNMDRAGFWLGGDPPPDPPPAGQHVNPSTRVFLRLSRVDTDVWRGEISRDSGMPVTWETVGDDQTYALNPSMLGDFVVDWPWCWDFGVAQSAFWKTGSL